MAAHFNKAITTLSFFTLLNSMALAINPVYVSPTGSDSNDGAAPGSAVQTISKGIELADEGATVNVAAGSYSEQLSVSKPVALIGANAGVSAVSGSRAAESILSASGPIVYFDAAAAGSRLDGFKLTGASNDQNNGVINCAANDLAITNNIVDGNSGHGINALNVTNFWMEGNKITNVTGSSRSGAFLRGLHDSMIKFNQIDTTSYAGIITDLLDNVTYLGNTISNVSQPGIQVAQSSGDVFLQHNHISNANTANGADKAAIALYPNAVKVSVTSNTISDSYGAVSVRAQSGTVSADVHVNGNNFLGNHAGYTAPTVKNRAQGGGMLDATQNWWGAATGPTANDRTEANVLFDPFRTTVSAVKGWMHY